MRNSKTVESGSCTQNFSMDFDLYDLIRKSAKRYDCTFSSFIRLGVILACKKLDNKTKAKGRKLIGIK